MARPITKGINTTICTMIHVRNVDRLASRKAPHKARPYESGKTTKATSAASGSMSLKMSSITVAFWMDGA